MIVNGEEVTSQGSTVESLLDELRSAYEASEARFRALIENSSDVTAIVDPQGVMTYISGSIVDVLGYTPSELVGQVGFHFVHTDDEAHMRAVFAELQVRSKVTSQRFRARHQDGTWRWLEAKAINLVHDPAVQGMVYTVRDVTAQHDLERRLRQSERLEAVGQLAGGISHDFNNVLLVIRGYTSILKSSIDDEAQLADVEEIARAAERAAELTRQLLAFSRRQLLQPALVDLRDVVTGMESLLRRSIQEDIEFRLDLDHDIAPVLADAGQMEQVILNLVLNARDAMPSGGSIDISVSPVELSDDANVSPPLPPGSYVALGVTDAGTGIALGDLPHIFEPFFTTKADGVGTGLGLSTVYGIVAQSGGGIEVMTLPTGGTRMTVFLPATTGTVESAAVDPILLRLPAGTETVLLVEDEEPVRELVARVLEDVGYEVLAAARPSEAQRIVAERQIDLLLTDIVMPEMSGYDLATRVRLAQPEARTLFMSGYAHKALGEASELPQGELLRKPFSPEQLTRAVRSVLDDGDVLGATA
jgi:two-component system cell cycle sensor histidine kinase/response regulator CckA